MKVINVILLSCAVFWSFPGVCESKTEPFVVNPVTSHQVKFGTHMKVLEDPNKKMSEQEVLSGTFDHLFVPAVSDSPKYGYNKNYPFWGVFELTNPSSEPVDILLESYYGVIDYLTIFQVNSAGDVTYRKQLGDKIPYKDRTIRYRNPIYELQLQPGVNKFYFKSQTTSGVQFNFYLWDRLSFSNFKIVESVFVGFIFGGIAVLGLYNLFLAISTREKTYLYYVFYTLAYSIFAIGYFGFISLVSGDDQKDAFLTGADLYIVIDFISITALAFSIDFLNTKQYSKVIHNIMRGCIAVSLINVLVNAFGGGSVGAGILLTVGLSLILSLFLICSGTYIWIKGYTPAKFYVLAWSFLLVGNITLILEGAGVLQGNFLTSWSQFTGQLAEMILLSLALGSKMNMVKKQKFVLERKLRQESEEKKKAQEAFIEVQEESIRTLDAKIKEKTRDIREILHHIQQGIFTFKKDFKIMPDYSNFLEDMIGEKELAGTSLFDVLLAKSNLSGDDLENNRAILDSCLGADDITWELNAEGLVTNLTYEKSKDEVTYIDIDWGAVANDDGMTEKILVSARDVTEIRRLEAEAAKKDKKLNILMEILDQDLGQVENFITRTENRIFDVHSILNSYQGTKEEYQALYRDFHTIKGNARSLGFKGISDQTHEVETVLKRVGDGEAPTKELIESSNILFDIIKEYESLFSEKFKHATLGEVKNIKDISFEDFIDNTIKPGLVQLAKDLGKEEPKILIHNPGKYHIIADQLDEMFQNMLNHLTRNSIDHGIESLEERIAKDKPSYGTITIDIGFILPGIMRFKYSDDGRGLNITKIRNMALEHGLISEDARLSEIAKQVFAAGISTAAEVTNISGRGVGLDAVSHSVKTLAADLEIIIQYGVDEEALLKQAGDPNAPDVFVDFQIIGDFKLSELAEAS